MLAHGIRDNTSLGFLDLQDNGLADRGTVAIGDALARNAALRRLELRHNGISAEGVRSLAGGLAANQRLAWLGLRGNHVCLEGAQFLAAGIVANAGALEEVDLQDCRQMGELGESVVRAAVERGAHRVTVLGLGGGEQQRRISATLGAG